MNILSETFSDIAKSFGQNMHALSLVWFWIFPIPLYSLVKFFWLKRVQGIYAGTLDWTLLEIIPPKDIEKSPKPMESLYAGMQGTQKGFDVIEEFIDGQFPVSFSLELVSDGGDVHFYVRTQRGFRNLVEAHLYAQYPDCIISEVPDYVDDVPRIVPNEKWDLWGTDLEFTKNDAYPIRTYKNFEESITGKMIDPLSGLVETLGKLPPGQKIWFQIIISPHDPSKWKSEVGKALVEKLKGKEVKKKGFFEDLWNDLSDVFTNLIPALTRPVEFSKAEKAAEQPLEFKLSPVEKDVLKAVEENLGKPQFVAKMRFLLLGRRDNFDKSNVSSFMGALRQFSDENMNGFKPNNATKTFSKFFWKKPRLRYRQRKVLRRYRDRSFDGITMTLSTEELATLYHLPDMSVVAPSLPRVEAKRSGAPANLPIE